MSIRRSFRSSRCSRPRGRASERGQALVMAFLLLLFVLPMGMVLYRTVSQTMRAAVAESRARSATAYANGVLMDYMRQFSNNPYAGHYDAASLARSKFFYAQGFSSATFIADPVNHDLYLRAEGTFTSGGSPTKRVIEALIHFQSPLTKYGTMVNGPFTISANNAAYAGGMWINGNLTVTGNPVTWNGGPLLVNGSVIGAAGATLDGNLYYGGAGTGGLTVNGDRFNFVPSVSWPAIDQGFYYANSTYVSNANRTIVFNSTGTYSVVGGPTQAIPPSGAILYCNGCNFTISGVVSGRVTVVAAGTAGSGTQGNITVNNNLYYAGASSMSATAANSFAALASNSIAFTKASGNMSVAGTYFVQQGTTNMSISGPAAASFWLSGVRTQGMTISGFNNGRTMSYDPNLLAYPPPGLPETPMLVGYRAR